jgi:4-carboxymuconolactone decarboxylase
MNRIPYITIENFTDAQKQLCELITGVKGSHGQSLESFFTNEGGRKGPFNAFLYNPVIGEAAQRLGEVLRFEGSLSSPLRELAILRVAAKWEAQYEWWAHERIGRMDWMNTCLKACKRLSNRILTTRQKHWFLRFPGN